MVDNGSSARLEVPLGCAPLANALWGKIMKFSPRKLWMNRDRFAFASQHASPLLHSMLHLTGNGLGGPHEVSMDALKQFCEAGSSTLRHQKSSQMTNGVEVATGSQGFANAVGMAIAEQQLAARFNREGFPLFDHCTYVLAGHGCLSEGVASEAASLAGHLHLHKLIVFYEDNNVAIGCSTRVPAAFEAKEWNVLHMSGEDVNDSIAFEQVVEEAKSQTQKPTIIIMKTSFGKSRSVTDALRKKWFTPEGLRRSEDHVDHQVADLVESALDDLRSWGMSAIDAKVPKFFVPRKVLKKFRNFGEHGDDLAEEWEDMLQEYYSTFMGKEPELVKDLQERMRSGCPTEKQKCSPEDHLAMLEQSMNGSLSILGNSAGAILELVPPAKRRKLTEATSKEHACLAILDGISSYFSPCYTV